MNDIRSPYALKYNDALRQRVAEDMARLKAVVDDSIEDLPRRRIRMEDHHIPLPESFSPNNIRGEVQIAA